jgi:transcriptional regulator GlxA family with amidase domain
MVLIPGDEFYAATTDWNRWFSVFVPNEMLADSSETPAAIGSSSSFIRLLPNRAERFRTAVERLGSIVRKAPAAFGSTAVLNTTARKLAETVREVLRGKLDETRRPGRTAVARRQIIRNAMDFVDDHAGEYLSVEQLANAAGISERALRTAFHDCFGVGPVRYLKLRTLRQARQAFKDADCSTTVAEIATRFGAWGFGRFAHDYRLLFGELPSETLRHQR